MNNTLVQIFWANNRGYLELLQRSEQAIVNYVESSGNYYDFKKHYPRLRTIYSNTEYIVIRSIATNDGTTTIYDEYNRTFLLSDFDFKNLNKIVEALATDD